MIFQAIKRLIRKALKHSIPEQEQSTTAKAASVILADNPDSLTLVHEILDRADATMRRIEMQRANVRY